MKVAFILTQTSTGSAGSFVKTHQICKHLKNYDIATTILCPFNDDIKIIKDVEIELIPTFVSRLGLSSLSYKVARKMASSTFTSGIFLSETSIKQMIKIIKSGLEKILIKKKFDVIYAIQPIAALAAAPLAREKNIPLVTELNNIWPEEAIISGKIERDDKTFHFLREIEQQVIDSSNAVVVVSEFMKSYILENYNASNTTFAIQTSVGPIISQNNVTREKNVVYAGMVGPRSHVDLFAKSIPFVKYDASFFISNKGDSIKQIKKITKNFSNKVDYFWFPKWDDILKFLQKSSIGVLTASNDITWKIGHPSKMFDYMACGLPLIANDVDGWWTEFIKKEQIGILVKDDPKDFAQCVDLMLDDDENWKKMHNNALELIRKKYNWNMSVKENLVPLFSQLLGENLHN